MKNLLLVVVFLGINLCGSSQTNLLEVDFLYNGKKIDSSHFDIFLYTSLNGSDVIYSLPLHEGEILLPELPHGQKAHFMILYRDNFYGFGDISLGLKQKMKWVFGVDRRRLGELFSQDEERQNPMVFVEFHPKEFGDGTVQMISINDFGEYLRSCKKIMTFGNKW